MNQTEGRLVEIGKMGYRDAWAFQQDLLEARADGRIPDTLLFVEHPPVYTFGRRTDRENLLFAPAEYAAMGYEVVETNRGGDVTFHGPGQVVGYPILDLAGHKKDVHWYVRTLEESLIQSCAAFGLDAGRVDGRTGVWIGPRKIAAIGIRISRWVTMHGFAFNVKTDLNHFRNIVPCGISDAAVTSLEAELGRDCSMDEWKTAYRESFTRVFDRTLVEQSKLELDALISPIPVS